MTKKKDKEKSALSVMKGIDAPESVDANAAKRFLQKRKKDTDVNRLVDKILTGDKTALSTAITIIESVHPKHRESAEQLVEKCLPFSGNSIRIGITGVPGVGKSTFIEAMGTYLTKLGHKLAVLAIDPSSQQSGGSILGDKTRMEELSANPDAFIRPSPSGSTLGGVARKTRETVILCEAAGFDIIFIETVGVGQSETTVHSMVDFFLLLMLSGAGDELQGIKRGIMEMADTIIINKADGDNIKKAELAKREYKNALHLFPPTESEWYPKVLLTSAIKNTGIDDVWETINNYIKHTKGNNYWHVNRSRQAKYRMHETIIDSLKSGFYQSDDLKEDIIKFEQMVQEGKTSPFFAAKQLLNKHFGK